MSGSSEVLEVPSGPNLATVVGCFAVGILMLAVAGAIIIPVMNQSRTSIQTKLCMTNLKAMATGLTMYCYDNNDSLPAGQWMDKIFVYEDDPLAYACPVQRRLDPETFGYALNKKLPGTALKSIFDAGTTIMVFDSKITSKNAIASIDEVPNPGRHANGNSNNVAYADGHAAAVKLK